MALMWTQSQLVGKKFTKVFFDVEQCKQSIKINIKIKMYKFHFKIMKVPSISWLRGPLTMDRTLMKAHWNFRHEKVLIKSDNFVSFTTAAILFQVMKYFITFQSILTAAQLYTLLHMKVQLIKFVNTLKNANLWFQFRFCV